VLKKSIFKKAEDVTAQ